MQPNNQNKESSRIFPALMVLAIALVAVGQLHLLHEMRKLHQLAASQTENAAYNHQPESNPVPYSPFDRDHHQLISAPRMQQNSGATIAMLEERVKELARAVEHPPGVRAVAEYNVMSPPSASGDTEPPMEKRGWGEEQIVGPPDTPTASDAQSAWAPREQNAGHEWLAVDFAQAVDVAEVRIRETYNPGAISKVTGVVNGQELVLWEGNATGGAAPRDFVVPVQGPLQANSVVVHLDTSRVPGWNEIDAVELIGKDGSRQWASSVTASSSYAEGRNSGNRRQLLSEEMLFLNR